MSNHPNRSAGRKPGRNPTPKEIAQTREEAGLTQTEAANLLYVSLSGWQRWEQGERRMHPALWEYFVLLVTFGEVEKARRTWLEQPGGFFDPRHS
jgi:DNA-binding transcriptional regulator YiaG